MAKKSAIEKNNRRKRMVKKYAAKRAQLRAVARDRSLPPEERFQAYLKLAKLPRNGAPSRVRNRCELTGRPRGFYRKFRLSRIAVRELGSVGQIPGMVKSSW
ncbi:MAG: 30S ribosomal protein S14 [Kiloniellales bacterium]|jgi:small subunit ribosomal protein S14